jgi:hypothetical protein
LVGVDSRTDAQDNPLPAGVPVQLHSGPDTGVINFDTIILLHVPPEGRAAIAFATRTVLGETVCLTLFASTTMDGCCRR